MGTNNPVRGSKVGLYIFLFIHITEIEFKNNSSIIEKKKKN